MHIRTYRNANKISEKHISDIAHRQAECWGAKPFDEYRICDNSDCSGIFSLEEALGDPLNIRKEKSANLSFSCLECGNKTSEMYQKEYVIKMMGEFFQGEVNVLLVTDEEHSVEGFGVTSKTTIRGLMENEFNTRPSSYEIENTIKKIGSILYDSEDADEKEVICFHQIYLSPIVRNSNLSYKVLKELFEIGRNRYEGVPTIGETRYDCKFYPISRSMGFKNIEHDKHGYVIQQIPDYTKVLEFLDSHLSYNSFLGDMIQFKRESKGIISQHPELSGRKFYK